MEIIKQRKAGQGLVSGQSIEDFSPHLRGKGKARAQQDVAGSLRTDRQNLRTAELEVLFKVSATSFLPISTMPLSCPCGRLMCAHRRMSGDPCVWTARTCAVLSWSLV